MLNCSEKIPPTKLHNPKLHHQIWMDCYIQIKTSFLVLNLICCVSISTRWMAFKIGTGVSYLKWFSYLKSHNPINTWSREVTWYLYVIPKYATFLLPQSPWLLNVAKRWWTSSNKVTQPFSVVFCDHVTNQKRFFSTTAITGVAKVSSVVT